MKSDARTRQTRANFYIFYFFTLDSITGLSMIALSRRLLINYLITQIDLYLPGPG